MDNKKYLTNLFEQSCFSRNELRCAMHDCGFQISESLFKVKLQELIKTNKIFRVGRNAYCVAQIGVHKYSCEYSDLSKNAARIIKEQHPYLDFTLFELIQLNEFVNHQFAHNIVFLSVEGDLGDFVFDTLKETYPGKVLINPTIAVFHQYWYDDMFVIEKSVTEAPKEQSCPWAARLEKFLVDIVADPLIQNTVSEAEYPNIYETVFQKYVVDESCLFRYARRRGVEQKILRLIQQNTNIQLRTRR